MCPRSIESQTRSVNHIPLCVPLDPDFQAAGHPSGFLRLPDELVESVLARQAERDKSKCNDLTLHDPRKINVQSLLVKPCTQREADFYDYIYATNHSLIKCIPRFFGHLELPASRHVVGNGQTASQIIADAIILENLTAHFVHPSILDYKLGNILYDPLDATAEKAARMINKAKTSTSLELAGRISGMKVWHSGDEKYRVFDKLFGHSLTTKTIGQQGFAQFFGPILAKQASIGLKKYVHAMTSQLEDILDVLRSSRVQMRGASVLILYESDAAKMEDFAEEDDRNSSECPMVLCKLIDFAHTRFMPNEKPGDPGVILGIANLISLLNDCLEIT